MDAPPDRCPAALYGCVGHLFSAEGAARPGCGDKLCMACCGTLFPARCSTPACTAVKAAEKKIEIINDDGTAAQDAAARRISMLAATRGEGDGGGGEMPVPLALQFNDQAAAALPAVVHNDAHSEHEGSVGSLDGSDAAGDEDGSPAELEPAAWFDSDYQATYAWPGGPLVHDPVDFGFVPPAEAADAANDDEGGDPEDAGRDTRLGHWHGRDSIGLAAHGREMYCDFCNLGVRSYNACMARDMLQQTRIVEIRDTHTMKRARNQQDDRMCDVTRSVPG